MPRLPRYTQESSYYHIVTRGINKDFIFEKSEYKHKILELYGDADHSWQIYAYAIMGNHTHFIVSEDMKEISNIMKKVNIKYSAFYNKQTNGVGAVFQGRFHSRPIYDERQLYENIKYINNNPVKANIVDEPYKYNFSGFREYFGDRKFICEEAVKMVGNSFGDEEEFYKFHQKPLVGLPLDTPEDMMLAIDEHLEMIKDDSLDDKIFYLHELGISNRSIAETLGISRNIIGKKLNDIEKG